MSRITENKQIVIGQYKPNRLKKLSILTGGRKVQLGTLIKLPFYWWPERRSG
jgi:hypothetical protein